MLGCFHSISCDSSLITVGRKPPQSRRQIQAFPHIIRYGLLNYDDNALTRGDAAHGKKRGLYLCARGPTWRFSRAQSRLQSTFEVVSAVFLLFCCSVRQCGAGSSHDRNNGPSECRCFPSLRPISAWTSVPGTLGFQCRRRRHFCFPQVFLELNRVTVPGTA